MEKLENCQSSKMLPSEKLAFSGIPQQSQLFLDYLRRAPEAEKFYPSTVGFHGELAARVPDVLANHKTDRNALADALTAANKSWNASQETLSNIELLRESDCVAVVTGQQAGLFTGALYTIYKALSAIKVTACLRGRGVKAVPVFWIASEDHDFAEVAKTFVQNREGRLQEINISTNAENEGLPIGKIIFNETINEAIDKLFAELPKTEFSSKLQNLISESYSPNRTLSEAFALVLSRLFGKYGLVLLDPLDEKLKKLAAPIYAKAVETSAEITRALRARSEDLVAANYHAQILIEEDSFPFFWFDDQGKRQSLKFQIPNSKFRSRSGKEFELTDLVDLALTNPARLSPNATLRAAVQDFLLPTACYIGGSAEVAYWAQTSEVYRILQRPVTPILHRASVTIIEPNVRRTLEKYDLDLADFFEKPEILQAKIVEKFLNNETGKVFASTEEVINTQLNRLDRALLMVEPSLSENLAKRRRKILYHIGTMRKKFYHAEMIKNETVNRRLETAYMALYPQKGLQERSLNITTLLSRHGENVLQWIYDVIDADAKEHQIFYL